MGKNKHSKLGEKLIKYTLKRNCKKISRLIKKNKKLNVNYKNKFGHSALYFACVMGYEDVVDVLLTSNCINLNDKDVIGLDYVMLLYMLHKEDIVIKFVRSQKYKINELLNLYDINLLEFACLRKKINLIHVILEREDLDKNCTSSSGVNLIECAKNILDNSEFEFRLTKCANKK